MAYSSDTYTASASQTDFTVTFEYIAETHVQVYVDGVEDTTYTWPNSTTIRLTSAASGGETIFIERNTPVDARLVDFVDATTLTAGTLDRDSNQTFFIVQEALDNSLSALVVDSVDGDIDARGLNIKDLADPVDDQDAATKAYVDAAVVDGNFGVDGGKWDAESQGIKNVTDPDDPQDAATKNYVDVTLATSGNVPAPADPADDGKTLVASGGVFSWEQLDTAAIADDAVDNDAIADDAVDSDQIADGAIDTVHLADDSVTLAKLAHGTARRMIGFDESGTPQEMPFHGGIMIDYGYVSAVSSVDILQNEYSDLWIMLDDVYPGTDGKLLYAVFSDDYGSTWQTGGSDYTWATQLSGTGYQDTYDDVITMTNNMGNSAIVRAGTFALHVGGMNQVVDAGYGQITWYGGYGDNSGNRKSCQGYGRTVNYGGWDGLRLAMSSGSTISAQYRVYGMKAV